MKKTKIAQQIVEREYARALVKLAIGGMGGIKAPGYSAPTTSGSPSTSSGPKFSMPAMPQAVQPIKPAVPPTTAGAFAQGMGQGAKNMVGGVGNFLRGGFTAAGGLAGLAGAELAHQGASAVDYLAGTKLAPTYGTDQARKPFADAVTSGLSDATNSFGQYVGVRDAPTAVSDMRAQHRASLPQDTRTPEQRAQDVQGWANTTNRVLNFGFEGDESTQATSQSWAPYLDKLTTPRGQFDAAYGVADTATDMIPATAAMGALPVAGAAAGSKLVSAAPNVLKPVAQTAVNTAKGWSQGTGLTGNSAGALAGQITGLAAAPSVEQVAGLAPGTISNNPALFPYTAAAGATSAAAQGGIAPVNTVDALARSLTPEQRQLAEQDPEQFNTGSSFSPEQKALASDLYNGDQQQPDAVPEEVTPDATEQAAGQADQPAGATPQQPGQQQPLTEQELSTKLSDKNTPPEQKIQLAQDHVKQLMSDPAVKKGADDLIADPNSQTPEALAYKQRIDQAGQGELQSALQDYIKKNPGASQQDVGGFIGNFTKGWEAMPFEHKLLAGLGLGMGVIGMMSSMFGGGGMAGGLLGVLGLGGAAFMGANAGMFGADAQNFGQSAMSSIGSILGAPNPDDIKKEVAAIAKLPPDQQKVEMEKIRAKVGPWANWSDDAQKFMAVSENNALPNQQALEGQITAAALQGSEQANAALAAAQKQVAPWAELDPNAQKFMTDSSDKNYLYNKAEQYANDNYAKLFDERVQNPTNWEERAGNILGLTGEAANTPGTWSHYLSNLSKSKEDRINSELAAKGYKKSEVVNIMQKAAKCWSGYERVPGTKAYSEGSCRPKGSKKTKKEVIQGKNHSEKKAGGPGTSAVTLGTQELPRREITYREGSLTPDEAAQIQAHFARRTDAYAQSMAQAKSPEAVRKTLEGYGRANYGKKNKFNERIVEILKGTDVPAPVAGLPVPQQAPRQNIPRPGCPNGRCPTPSPRQAPRPRQTPPSLPKRPTMNQMPPQTTSTGTATPPISSIGANGQYQPSVFSPNGVGLPR
jgi:hypothetical protein